MSLTSTSTTCWWQIIWTLFEEVGGYAAYILENKNIDVSDGLLTIELVGVKENAKISALAILPARQ